MSEEILNIIRYINDQKLELQATFPIRDGEDYATGCLHTLELLLDFIKDMRQTEKAEVQDD